MFRNFTFGLLAMAVLAIFAVNGLRAEPAEPSRPATNIAPEQIEQWVTQLDDDRFDTRQRAQQLLAQTGKLALKAVATVAESGSLESSTRAINILLLWSEGAQQNLQFAALENLQFAALEQLANLSNRPRESAMATRLLAEARERAALIAIAQLGARVGRDTQVRGKDNLQVVIGPQWQGGNEGLRHLVDVSHATTISLHVAPLDSSAVDYLTPLPQVRRIELYGTKFSPAAVAKLKEQLPAGAQVFERGPAMLGIRGNVESVVRNSAAHKAGIRVGDRITKFNDEKVADFEALTQHIAQQKAGDTVTLTVLRNNQTLEVQVTFDQWGATPPAEVVPQRLVPMQVLPGLPPNIIVPPKRR